MHSFSWTGKAWKEQGYGEAKDVTVTFHYNGSFDGNVKVELPNKVGDVSVHHGAGPNGEGLAEVHIPFEAMKVLVINYLRMEVVSFAEVASDESFERFLRGILNVRSV